MSIQLTSHFGLLVVLALAIVAVRIAAPIAKRWWRVRLANRELTARRSAWGQTRG